MRTSTHRVLLDAQPPSHCRRRDGLHVTSSGRHPEARGPWLTPVSAAGRAHASRDGARPTSSRVRSRAVPGKNPGQGAQRMAGVVHKESGSHLRSVSHVVLFFSLTSLQIWYIELWLNTRNPNSFPLISKQMLKSFRGYTNFEVTYNRAKSILRNNAPHRKKVNHLTNILRHSKNSKPNAIGAKTQS